MATVAAPTAAIQPRRHGTWRRARKRVMLYVALAFYFVIACFPLYWMVMATLKNDYDLIDPTVSPFWFRRPLGLSHFQYLFQSTNFVTWALNTAIVAVCVLAITMLLCIPAGYALARLNFKGAQQLGIGVFLTYLIPPILLFLPLNQIVANVFQLANTRWALVLVYPTFTIPFCLWLLMGFFKPIPPAIVGADRVVGGECR